MSEGPGSGPLAGITGSATEQLDDAEFDRFEQVIAGGADHKHPQPPALHGLADVLGDAHIDLPESVREIFPELAAHSTRESESSQALLVSTQDAATGTTNGSWNGSHAAIPVGMPPPPPEPLRRVYSQDSTASATAAQLPMDDA